MNNKYGRIAIIGAGDLGVQIAHTALLSGYNIVGFFDDYFGFPIVFNGLPLMGSIGNIFDMRDKYDSIIIGVGYKHFQVRALLYQTLKENHIPLAIIIHNTAYVDNTALLGEGTVVQANVTIDKGCIVGNNVFINICSTIAHDSYIGDHSFLAPCVAVAGATRVGICSFIGTNATIINRLQITGNVVIGAGAVVTKDIKEPGTYVGCPAHKIKD